MQLMKKLSALLILILAIAVAILGYVAFDLTQQVKDLQTSVRATNSLVSQSDNQLKAIGTQVANQPAQETTQIGLTCQGFAAPDMMADNSQSSITLTCN